MTHASPKFLAFLDRHVTQEIADTYALDPCKAPLAILDLWETEQLTGDPRNSVHVWAV